MTHFQITLTVVLALATCAEKKEQVETPAKRSAETVIRAGAIHTMGRERVPMRSIAIGDGRVLAVGERPHDLDELVGKDTKVIDDPGLTLLPGFIDTHTHLIFASDAVPDVT